jgi:hypothetical protein
VAVLGEGKRGEKVKQRGWGGDFIALAGWSGDYKKCYYIVMLFQMKNPQYLDGYAGIMRNPHL